MKDLEKMTQEELERAYRDARNIGDASRQDLLEDELDRRERARESTCLACPPGCPECTTDEADCECYTHQDDHPDAAEGGDQ